MKENLTALTTKADLDTLINHSPLAIVVTYRGSWCPFCLKYLKALNQAKHRLPTDHTLLGISVYNTHECQALQAKLKLNFPLVSDEHLIMRDHFGVQTGKGHGKEAYLQPSVFIFHDGEKVFEWIQTPKLLNFGGAIARMPVPEVIEKALKIVGQAEPA